jgi:hypothetical protein
MKTSRGSRLSCRSPRAALTFDPSRVISMVGTVFGVVVACTRCGRTAPEPQRVIIVTIAPLIVSAVPWVVIPSRIVAVEHRGFR